MRYLGGKARIAKKLLPLILADRKPDQWYVEPFVGGANTFVLVDGPKLGQDVNHYQVALLTAIRDGWQPPEALTREEYEHIRAHPTEHPPHLVAFAMVGCSFGGKWGAGYTGTPRKSADGPFGRIREAARGCLQMHKGLQGAILRSAPYNELLFAPESIIYCDPPYANSTGYAAAGAFNSEQFWQWCDLNCERGHRVFVSEYTAPDHWRSVWERSHYVAVDHAAGHQGKHTIERLFTREAR